ncbi:unnamed protein product [Trichobilharzia szidati]|nr:unnamed protein product [Trichobilharzia szidati]
MTTPDDIRSRMLHRASRLISGIRNEEAWHLIGLFQQTHPNTFLQICHHTLASFLELTHDYFDQGWPLMTRLMISNHKRGEHRRGRLRSHAVSSSTSKINVHEVFESPIGSPLFLSSTSDRITICPSLILSNSKSSDDQSKKMKIKTGSKRILNQLLPSMFPLPINDSNNNNNNTATKSARFDVTPTKQSSRSHSKTKSFFKHVQPLFSKSIITNNNSEAVSRQFTTTYPPFMLSQYNYYLTMNNNNTKWINDDYSAAYCTRYCNIDSKICATLIDYMITNPKLCLTEGVFRIPGNSLRIRELWCKLHQHFQSPYLRIPQPEPDSIDENLSPYPVINQYEIRQILECYSPHDISSLILRCLTTCTEFQRIHQVISFDATDTINTGVSYDASNDPHQHCCSFSDGEYQQTGGLIPLEAGNLLFLATELQYKLKINEHSQPDPNAVNYDDWVYILCHSRQLLAYRIVLQLLLPTPERFLLMNLLRLFKLIDESSSISKMTAECLSRCTAFAVFGAPLKVKRFTSNKETAGYNFESYTNSLTKRIDTLTNLIRMVHQLEDLPMLIYNAVRNRLRSHLGNSPIPRTTSHTNENTTTTTMSSTDRCCEDTLCCSMNCSLTSRREFMNTAHLIPCESITQICSNNQYNSLGSIKTDHSQTGKENFSRSDPNRVHIPRTKSTIDITKATTTRIHQKDCQKTNLLQTILTANNTTNPTNKLDPFQLWKRQKSGQEIRSAFINSNSSSSSSNVFITKCAGGGGGGGDVDDGDLPTSRVLIKSRSSSFLQESQGLHTQTWLRK